MTDQPPGGLRLIDPDAETLEQQQERFNDNAEYEPMRSVQCPRAPYDMEGKEIETTSITLKTNGGLEIDDRILKIDDIVELRIVGRVSGLGFPVDKKSGKLSRVQIVTVFESEYVKAYSPAGGVEFE